MKFDDFLNYRGLLKFENVEQGSQLLNDEIKMILSYSTGSRLIRLCKYYRNA